MLSEDSRTKSLAVLGRCGHHTDSLHGIHCAYWKLHCLEIARCSASADRCVCRFGDDTEQAVVLLSRTAFPAEHAQDILRSLVGVERLFHNDAYTKACRSCRSQPRPQQQVCPDCLDGDRKALEK